MRTARTLLALALAFTHAAGAADKAAANVAAEKSQRPLTEILSGPALDAYLKGRDLFEAGDVVTGHAKLLEAYELSKNPRLLWNLAACSKSGRQYARAIRELTTFLHDGRDQITADQAKRAEDVRATLYSLVATVTVKASPAGATITLDDEALPPGEGPYYLELGKHEVRVAHEGYRTESRIVDIKSTKALAVEFELRSEAAIAAAAAPIVVPSAVPAPSVPATPALAATPAPPAEADLTWAYATLGLGAAGVLAGTSFGLLASRNASDLDASCTNGVCPASSQSTLDAARRWATLSTVSWVVGGLGLAGGAYLYFGTPHAAGAPTALRVSPVSVSVEGSF